MSKSETKLAPEKASIQVLRDCIELQLRKGADYQSVHSSVKQADYYPRGCMTLLDIIQAKVLRMRSVLESYEAVGGQPNFESITDSAMDLINYGSFFAEFAMGKMQGQDSTKDILNRNPKQ